MVDPDPALIAFRTAYTGPGTDQFNSVANVVNDVYYFSEGGFRSLTTQTVTGEQRERDMGTRIAELNREFELLARVAQTRSRTPVAGHKNLASANDRLSNNQVLTGVV